MPSIYTCAKQNSLLIVHISSLSLSLFFFCVYYNYSGVFVIVLFVPYCVPLHAKSSPSSKSLSRTLWSYDCVWYWRYGAAHPVRASMVCVGVVYGVLPNIMYYNWGIALWGA